MEALSGVASGFAVASLSIQLVESVGKIITFVRNVKNAPTECIRLVELLERLHAFLENIRDVLERQSSLQAQGFPVPSMTIFKCLQGCENSLKPLQETIKRYEQSQTQQDSPLAVMKGNVKFSLKVKDIASFESRVQSEIQYLTSALVLNNTSIAIQVPSILNTRAPTSMTDSAPIHNDQIAPDSIYPHHDEVQQIGISTVVYSQRMSLVPSRFEWLGLRRQNLVKTAYLNANGARQATRRQKESCLEEHICSWTSRFLGYSIRWSKQYPYGQLLPSLTAYPVVSSLFEVLPFDMKRVSILEAQRLFTAGIVHPYTRDVTGLSLLHLAAICLRGDICQLLEGYGVRPDLELSNGLSPLWMMCHIGDFKPGDDGQLGRRIETLRVLFKESNLIDDFHGEIWGVGNIFYDYVAVHEQFEWMWRQSSNLLYGEDLWTCQLFCFKNIMFGYATGRMPGIPRLFISSEFRNRIESGDGKLLLYLFQEDDSSFQGYGRGSALITLLRGFDIDFQRCISNELDALRFVIPMFPYKNSYLNKKFKVKHSEEQD